jgi:hypothetical protein
MADAKKILRKTFATGTIRHPHIVKQNYALIDFSTENDMGCLARCQT